jgi:hypothetical protein
MFECSGVDIDFFHENKVLSSCRMQIQFRIRVNVKLGPDRKKKQHFGSTAQLLDVLQIVIKSMAGGSLSIFLQSGWTILDVKKHIGPRLGLDPVRESPWLS